MGMKVFMLASIEAETMQDSLATNRAYSNLANKFDITCALRNQMPNTEISVLNATAGERVFVKPTDFEKRQDHNC